MKALDVRQLKKSYNNGFQALKGVDLVVESGDFFALLGANGAGKSTTIGIITSLVNKTAGKVFVFGHDLDTSPAEVKRCIGLVPQEFNFNQFEKVLDIVAYQGGYYGLPRKKALLRAEVCLRQMELWDKRDEAAINLSGGMKRRLMIARALVHEPKLLILDEPTAGVDIEIRHSMWAFLKKLNENGTTIILTTHYLEEAENLCRHIAIIKEGRVVEHTNMKSLLDKADEQCFILSLKFPVQGIKPILGCRISPVDELTWQIFIEKEADINTLFKALDEQGIVVTGIRNKSNRLEQLFLNLLVSEEKGCNDEV